MATPFPVSSGSKRPKRVTTRGPLAVPVAVHVSWNKILARAGTATLFRCSGGSKRSKRGHPDVCAILPTSTQPVLQLLSFWRRSFFWRGTHHGRAPVAQWLEHRPFNLQVPRTTGHSCWRVVAGCSLQLAGSPRSIPAVLGSCFMQDGED